MISGEGERVDLNSPVDPESTANKGNVERWLLELENLQWESVRRQVELSLEEYPTMERTAWTLNWPAQAVIATSAIFWTSDVNKTIETGGYAALNEYVLELNKGLTAIVMLVRGQLSKLQRKTLSALVVMDVHSRDTCVSMATAQVDKVSDFNWQSQLRYYWEPSWKDGQAVKKGQKTAVARIVNARCLYGYEYLGNSMRLVITPLTDRCYRTMISAIDLLYGGAPEGPAGTGKTETVKDLSKAMAIQCVVFNCSDGLDYKAMAKFFKGLAGCGSWCCFDEFNRINVEVLSVIAQQILTINKGKAAGVEKFQFEGTFMKLNPNANPFITMNPGYAGRAELPDNLKALFRPCAMMVPDYALIGEIRLYSFGFEDARRSAEARADAPAVGGDPAWDESKIVLRSVMDVNLPKFTVEDLPLFRGITSDLFPGVELPTADHGALIPTIDEICWSGAVVAPGREYKLEPLGSFTLKIVQLYEMVLVRHGVMIVGQTLSGKTSAIHTLASAMTNDGILAVIFRNCAMDTGKDRMWVMFDGPVDAVWIENMNTVLDDNKKLCLMSGEIIKMTDRMTMMFEAEDLEQASPATVSRVGMIFCETRNLGWKPFLSVWTETLEEPWAAHAELFGELYEWLFPPMTYFVDKFCAVPTPITLIELMRASLRLLDCFMADAAVAGIGNDVPRSVEGLFILAIVWSVGACVDFEGRKKFARSCGSCSRAAKEIEGSDEYVDFKNKTPAYDDEVKRASNLAPPAEGGSVHDFKFHCKTGTWASWVEPGSRFSIPKDAEFNSVVVPTVDTVRHEWLIEQLLVQGFHVLTTGDTGTGKSVSVKNHRLLSGEDDRYTNIILNFSAQTSANQTQDIIDSKLDKRRKGVLGPPLGKTCFIFWMDHAGWYNREENSFRQLIDIQFIAAMGPPGGGRTQITQRYVRHFNMINFVPFNQESLTRVFLTILDWSLGSYNNAVKSLSGAVVFQGLSQGHPDVIDGKEAFVSLWCHECMRVFHDRLINDGDRAWFVKELGKGVSDTFALDYAAKVLVPGLPLMFGSYLDHTSMPDKRKYRKVVEEATLHESMQYFLLDYNQNSGKRMSLVLFLNAMEHISRIARIINQPYGNALLMGVGGSGRKSLTTLAVYICDYEMIQIEISKSYGRTEWVEDLKKIFVKAGAEGGDGRPTVFLFDDTQIVYESFLEDVNLVLNTGEVPNLFVQEDLAAINDQIGKNANAAGVNTGVMAEMYKYFISRCRANLHVVLTMSPIGDAFRRRLRMFPALVNCCTIDWFTAWPEEALRSVAEFFLGSEKMDDELINTFKKLLEVQREDVMERKVRYDNGLEKILSTEAQVDGMQRDLVALQPKLKQATIDTDALLEKIAVDTKEANKVEAVVSTERKLCNDQAAEAAGIAESCQADLDKAMPALEGAIAALKSLSKGDIVEIKAMKKPPDAVKLVMEAVCLMMAVKPDKIKDPNGGNKKIDDYWGPAQKNLLGDPRFLQHLMEYDRDNMAPAMVEKVITYTTKEQFQVDVVKKASIAAAGLCRWVSAMMIYDKVAKDVGPKKKALKEAEQSLKSAKEALEEKEATLAEVQKKLQTLQDQLDAANKKKGDLQTQVTDCATKLERAEQLIKGLGGEKVRWNELSEELAGKYENVTGDILLSSGVIAYLGAFVVQYRDDALSQWKLLLDKFKIPFTDGFTLRSTLGDEVAIRSWVINKLPNDEFSIENAIMLERSNRWPLMIDPQGQANKWVKKTYAENLKVVKLNQATFARTIENAIPFGNPVLVENVGEVLDPVLEPVLLKQIIKQGGVNSLRFGDSTIEYDERFRMFITTKMRNPHYPPELCVKVNLLNFMATTEGLEDQMLGLAVACEEAELEAQREQLVMEDAENKRQLKEIEDKILYLLKTAEGNILDDENLIDTLKESKIKSKKIEEKLFFCIADLSIIDPMYQYSMEWYQALFRDAMGKAAFSTDLEERLASLKDTFTYILYQNSKLDPTHLRFFLAGNTSMERERSIPETDWLTDKSWGDVLAIGKLEGFEGFVDKFVDNLDMWKTVYESKQPMEDLVLLVGDSRHLVDEAAKLAEEGEEAREADGLSAFQQLCALRAIRPDAVVPQVQSFVREEMGARFIEVPQFDLSGCFADSRCNTPLLFVLTPGADPMSALYKLAEEKGFMGKRLHAISLGQGQGDIAYAAISEAQDKGTWVCLQNCHLCISWMPTLERLCEELSPDRINDQFRLWLTSEPSAAFPAYILQNGIKMTIEPPKGMRANLIGSYDAHHDGLRRGRQAERGVQAALRPVLLPRGRPRRRKFGPLGWNIQYVFSGSDLKISMDQLRIFLDNVESDEEVPYAALRYLTGECNYGGRVTDDKDRRCLANMLTDFYSEDIQNPSYTFSPSGRYYAPPDGDLASYTEYIKGLPYTEGPELFGLHDNANITCALGETNLLLSTVLSLQPRSSGGAGKSWDDELAEVSSDIEARLPKLYDIERALIDFPVLYESMNTVLTQELLRFNKLSDLIKRLLKEVQRAIKGLVVMSGELESMGNAMVNGKAFITGTLQNYARKYQLPIDTVAFDFAILTPEKEVEAKATKAPDGSICHGLFLEGARWDVNGHVIAESRPRELYTVVPMFHMMPRVKGDIPPIKGRPSSTGSIGGEAHASARYTSACPARALLEKSANRGNSEAQAMLADRLMASGATRAAVLLYRASAAQGHARAIYNLGACYEQGKGVGGVDECNAFIYYQKAAAMGYRKAQFNLGNAYRTGKGLEDRDLGKAIDQYLLAAKQGSAEAQYNYALMYFNGMGCAVDKRRAIDYCKLAADQGYAPAVRKLPIWQMSPDRQRAAREAPPSSGGLRVAAAGAAVAALLWFWFA
ncbi:1-aminocyclopropane-1-carboxylate synthase [Aureococcus anophagefferens]|nr:1-aminocyclopropane-1-carboxylate synthase [Aureococcus anophagefferens]